MKSDLDEEATKDIFSKALEILREKFPFPDARILNLEIYDHSTSKSPGWRIFQSRDEIPVLF